MSTKTQIETQINTIQTGVLNPAITVREVLGTDPASILENSYSLNVQVDDETTTNVMTFETANLDYNLVINKQGGKVTINGYITNNSAAIVSSQTFWCLITNTEYSQDSNIYFANGTSNIDNSTIRLALASGYLRPLAPIGIGEGISFELTYNTLA